MYVNTAAMDGPGLLVVSASVDVVCVLLQPEGYPTRETAFLLGYFGKIDSCCLPLLAFIVSANFVEIVRGRGHN